MSTAATTFSQSFFHGTRADLQPGDMVAVGYPSNFDADTQLSWVYFTGTMDAAIWGAELAAGEKPGRIYIVEATGAWFDDPNVTDKKFPGNPTRSYRSNAPLRVIGEITNWTRLTPEALQLWRERLTALRSDERGEIIN